jgi:hypothetical protein
MFVVILLGTLALSAAEPPQAEISSRSMKARFYLPDPEIGYYRATRFDWSGVIASLRYAGHEYFGVWFPRYDPKINDAITGPVEEFRTNEAGLGYDAAGPGGTFIRIGVGVVRKPEERAYRPFNTYEIVDPGAWRTRTGRDRIEFTHTLAGGGGYAYIYRKTVRLDKKKPVMAIEHSLKNTGKLPIETSQYNHNFFMIDKLPIGPDVVVRFPFELKAKANLRGLAEVRGNEVVFLRELQNRQSAFTELEGFGGSAKDYDIRIENRKAGAGVRITGDRPLAKLVFWSIRTTACPEPWLNLRVEPGRETKWTISYEFYTLPRE